MTIKELFRKISQEKFDLTGYDVVFDDGTGDFPEIEAAMVDDHEKRVVFSSDPDYELDDYPVAGRDAALDE